jgi:hypothetical protein
VTQTAPRPSNRGLFLPFCRSDVGQMDDQARRERIRGLTRRLELLQSEIGDLSKETTSTQTSGKAARHMQAAVGGIKHAITSLRSVVGDNSTKSSGSYTTDASRAADCV